MAFTQSDIAQTLKIDRTTVSKILSGYQLDKFSPELVTKVQENAYVSGYQPKNYTSSIDVCYIFPCDAVSFQQYTYANRNFEVLLGIQQTISKTNNRLFIEKYNGNPEKISLSADAFIIWELSWDKKLLEKLKSAGKPFIVINRIFPEYTGSYVIHDWKYYVDTAVQCMLRANRTSLAYVTDKKSRGEEMEEIQRLLRRHRLSLQNKHIFYYYDTDTIKLEKAVHSIIRDKINGVIAANDFKAYTLRSEFLKKGINIPGDISLIGNHRINNINMHDFPITSFFTPWFEIGKQGAVSILSMARIKNKKAETEIHKIVKPVFAGGKSV